MGIKSETHSGGERTKYLNTLICALTLGHEGTTGVQTDRKHGTGNMKQGTREKGMSIFYGVRSLKSDEGL